MQCIHTSAIAALPPESIPNALGALVAQSAFGMLPVVGNFTPGKLLSWSSNLLSAQSAAYWGALVFTTVAIVACVAGTRLLVSRKEI